MILAQGEEEMQLALNLLLPHQQADFEGILEAMNGLEVTVSLPPILSAAVNTRQV